MHNWHDIIIQLTIIKRIHILFNIAQGIHIGIQLRTFDIVMDICMSVFID